MTKLFALCLLFLSSAVCAAAPVITLAWTVPSKNDDGSAIQNAPLTVSVYQCAAQTAGTCTKIKQNLAGASVQLTGIASGVWFYIVSVDTKGTESIPTARVQYLAPVASIVQPPTPINFGITVQL